MKSVSWERRCAFDIQGKQRAKELGNTYIPATEIDCTFKDSNLHVLGYGIDETVPFFQMLNDNILK